MGPQACHCSAPGPLSLKLSSAHTEQENCGMDSCKPQRYLEGGDDLVSCTLGPQSAGPGTLTVHLHEAAQSGDGVRGESYEHQG